MTEKTKTFVSTKGVGPTRIYEIVESIPQGYEIWNIGNNIEDGYLPLVQVNGNRVNTKTMKVIKVDGAQTILSGIGFGPRTIPEMERYIKRYSNSKHICTIKKVERMRKALEIMYTLKWDTMENTLEGDKTMEKTAKEIVKEIKETIKAEGINRSDVSINATNKMITIKNPFVDVKVFEKYKGVNYQFSISYQIKKEFLNIHTLIKLAKSKEDTNFILWVVITSITDEDIKNIIEDCAEKYDEYDKYFYLREARDNKTLQSDILSALEDTVEIIFNEAEKEEINKNENTNEAEQTTETANENKTAQTAGGTNNPAKDINLTVNIVDENEKINGIRLQRTYNIINLQTGKIVAEYYNRNEAEQKLQHLHKQAPKQYAGYEGGYLYPNDGNKIKMTVSPTLKIKTVKTLEKIKANLQWEMMNGDDYGVAEYIYDKIEEELNKKHNFV